MTEEQKHYEVVSATPAMMLSQLIANNASLDMIKQFMDLQERWEKAEARKAYHKAMAEFKKNPPEIDKDRKVSYKAGQGTTEYSHASLANVTDKINKA